MKLTGPFLSSLSRISVGRATPEPQDSVVQIPNTLLPVIELPQLLTNLKGGTFGSTERVRDSFMCQHVASFAADTTGTLFNLDEGVWDVLITHRQNAGSVIDIAAFSYLYIQQAVAGTTYLGGLNRFFPRVLTQSECWVANFKLTASRDSVISLKHQIENGAAAAVDFTAEVYVLANRLA
jgi:hypothetical protein